MSERRISSWLKGAVYRKHATTIQLARVKGGRRQNEVVQMFFVDTSGDEGFSERELSEEIFGVASEEALVLGGRRHRYELKADSEDIANISQMAFAIVNQDVAADADFEGGREGLVSQLMRHNEMYVRTMVGGFQMQIQTMTQLVETLGERLLASEERASEAMVLVNETQDQRLLLLAETKSVEADAAATAELQTQFIKWLPAIASHIMRKSGADISEGLPLALVEMLKSVSPDQMMKLTEVLGPEQAAVIGELYFSVHEPEGGTQ